MKKSLSMKMFSLLRGIITYLLWTVTLLCFTPILLLCTLFPPCIRYRNRFYFWLLALTSRLLVRATFGTFIYKNYDELKKNLEKPSIIIANHSSALDIPLIDGLLVSYPRLWISNSKFKKIPLFKTILTRINIALDPLRPKDSIQALEKAKIQAQTYHQHIILFPEGTRHSSETIQPFKQGFAALAEALDRPVIPLHIQNMHNFFPARALLPYDTNISVIITIGPAQKIYPGENRKDFIDRIERWFKLDRNIQP